MHWVYLVFAGLFETFWVVMLKLSHGFTRPLPTIATLVIMTLSFVLLSRALKVLPLGLGYAIWTGIGIVGTFVIGIVMFHDAVTLGQGLCVLLILIGIGGLRLM